MASVEIKNVYGYIDNIHIVKLTIISGNYIKYASESPRQFTQ